VIGCCTSTVGVPNVCCPPVYAYDIIAIELLLTSTDWPGPAEANATFVPSADQSGIVALWPGIATSARFDGTCVPVSGS
jgi:hypothetical protein